MSESETIQRQRRKSASVDTKDKWGVVCSAVRFELMEFLSACGPCSIAELAAQLGVKADSLYHHIRKLVEVELVEEVGFRRRGRRVEAVYDVVAERFDFDTNVDNEALMKLMRSVHRRSERTFEKALAAGTLDFREKTRNAYVRGETARLTPKQLKQVKQHITQIMDIFEDGRSSTTGDLFTLSFDLMPLRRGNPE